jgi:hypothetical protein
MVSNAMRTRSSSRGYVKKTDIAPYGEKILAATKAAHRKNPYTPDMAPAENRRRLVSCARVGINIYKVESMSERASERIRKRGRKTHVMHLVIRREFDGSIREYAQERRRMALKEP